MKPVYPGMKICLIDGGTGMVLDVLIDARTEEERYMVLSVDGYFGPKRVAPYSVAFYVDDRAHLALTSNEAAALPLFDPRAYGREAGLHRRPHTTTGT
jgi:hypothetical protein